MNKVKVGDRFGKLVAIADSGRRYHKHIIFECLCDCGKTHYVISMHLSSGSTKSCGCAQHQRGIKRPRTKAIIHKSTLSKKGTKINRLTIIDFKKELNTPLKVILRCDCGGVITKPSDEFFKGKIKSCGCISKEKSERARKKRLAIRQREELQRARKHEYIPAKDYTGMKFGKLTVLYLCGVMICNSVKDRVPLWYCKCDCGNFVVRATTKLKSYGRSCGCNRKRRRPPTSVKCRKPHGIRRVKSKTLKRLVILKYGEVCVRCNKEGTKPNPLHLHHYRSYSKHPELRFLVSNNILLCEECHDSLHKKLGFVDPPIMEQRKYILNKGA